MLCSTNDVQEEIPTTGTDCSKTWKRRERSSNHIIGNLIDRELNGKALHNLRGPSDPSNYNNSPYGNNHRNNGPFGKLPPERLHMSIHSIIPQYALEAGNVFMGFTECGRYLLSYQLKPNDMGLWNRNGDLSFIYKLNFWLFTPYKFAKEIYSIILFENQTIIHDNLLIEIAQWPNDSSKLLITGRSLNPAPCFDSLIYVTITTTPDAKPCPDCKYEPPDDGEEEYTEAAQIRKTCLTHGLTVHFAHDQVEPYPLFRPQIQLKCKDSVIINTGNVFHMFTILSVPPNEDSPFRQELLNPPRLACQIKNHRKRHLHCDFWFKNDLAKSSSVNLATILKNCSNVIGKRELRRYSKITNFSAAEQDEHIESLKKQMLLLSSLSTSNPETLYFPKRRLSASSCDSELSKSSGNAPPISVSEQSYGSSSSTTSLSWSWSKQPHPESSTPEFGNSDSEKSSTVSSRSTKMLPPQARKFFKELRRVWQKPFVPPFHPSRSSSTSQASNGVVKAAFDVFEVNTDEVPIDHNFSSFRRRKLADKKYEFNDGDDQLVAGDNSLLPRRRSTRKRVTNNNITISVDENSISSKCGSGASSPRCDPNNTALSIGSTTSPRLVPSPALSPSYSNPGEILRPITNYNSASILQSPLSPIFIELANFKCDEELLCESKETRRTTRASSKEHLESNAGPTFSTNINCIAKVLRCYAETDESDDNLSVRTDTDDEYNQTLPFPIALALNVLGKERQQLSMLSNSKARFCPTSRIEILQRSLDIEILCNEVSTMICLANGKYFCCCFDYDVAVVDICPERGDVTALAVVLFAATSLKRFQQEKYSAYNSNSGLSTIPGIPDPRKKYEAIFSFTWSPVEERARILYMGNLMELQSIPEQWNPTKYMIPHVTSVLNPYLSTPMPLRNDLAVTDSQSVYQLKDFDGMITLYRHETNYERLNRQRLEAKRRNRRVVSSTAFSTSESEQDEDCANMSITSESSMDSNDHT